MDTYRILVIDDEPMNCFMIKQILSVRYSVLIAESGNDGLKVATNQLPDLILLDLKMDGLNGYEVCEALRKNDVTKRIPIIIVSASNDPESRTRSFEMGADDFVGKPIVATELIARIDSKIRRLQEVATVAVKLDCGNLEIDTKGFQVKVNGAGINLSLIEYELLKCFVNNKNTVLSRRQILNWVWQGKEVSKRTIDTHIVSIRRKLKDFDHEIVAIYGVGYNLCPKVRN